MGNQASDNDKEDGFDKFADKVGMFPNVRRKDNLYQGVAVLAFAIIFTIIGFFVIGGGTGAIIGAMIGLLVGGLLSGFVLMIIGLKR